MNGTDKCTCCGAARIVLSGQPTPGLLASGLVCEHGFGCMCMERPVCLVCDHCSKHCRCGPNQILALSYVAALEEMRAEMRAEQTAWQARRILAGETYERPGDHRPMYDQPGKAAA